MSSDPARRRRSAERFEAYRSAADDETRRAIRDEIVNDHMALAVHLSRRFNHRGISDDDLVQVAAIGLIHAVERFDPDRGVEFSTFAAPTILGELKRYFRDRGWAVRIPRRLQELNLRLTSVADDLTHGLGRSPTIAEMATAVHVSDEEVLEALDAARAYRARPMGQVAGDDSTPVEAELGGEDIALLRTEDRLEVQRILTRLEPREQLMLRMRFFDEMTQQEIAERLGISQMQVSRLLARLLSRLRHELSDDH